MKHSALKLVECTVPKSAGRAPALLPMRGSVNGQRAADVFFDHTG